MKALPDWARLAKSIPAVLDPLPNTPPPPLPADTAAGVAAGVPLPKLKPEKRPAAEDFVVVADVADGLGTLGVDWTVSLATLMTVALVVNVKPPNTVGAEVDGVARPVVVDVEKTDAVGTGFDLDFGGNPNENETSEDDGAFAPN